MLRKNVSLEVQFLPSSTLRNRVKVNRTYPEYVEDETASVLKHRSDFLHGGSIRKPFVVEDGNLITARYPADAHLFAQKLVEKLELAE